MTPEFPVNQVAFIDDDDDLRAANVQALQLAGFEVLAFASAEAALKALSHDFPGAVVSDIRMPRMDGRQLFRKLKEEDPDLPVILVTGHADVAEAVEAMHEGAYDFVAKPYAAERLVASIRRALEKRRLVLDNRRLRAAADNAQSGWPLIGQTPVMERLRATLRQLADADVDVLLEGETGVGKELAARSLHNLGRRRNREFVAVDCAALPADTLESELFGHELGAFNGAVRQRVGRIQQADRGTLFLDEIETLTPVAQGKFLRVLEEREITPLAPTASGPWTCASWPPPSPISPRRWRRGHSVRTCFIASTSCASASRPCASVATIFSCSSRTSWPALASGSTGRTR